MPRLETGGVFLLRDAPYLNIAVSIAKGLCLGSIPDEIATKGNSSRELPITSLIAI